MFGLSHYPVNRSRLTVVYGWFGGLLFLLSGLPNVMAAPLLPEALLRSLEQHERVLAAEKEIAVAEEARRTAFAGYLPTVSATLFQGREHIDTAGGDDSTTNIHEYGVNLVQSLHDFGSTSAQVKVAQLGIEKAATALRVAREGLIMEGISAYLGLEKTVRRVDYALQSERNIMKQTGMEESRVETGAGIPSDVLQTKAQLTGTQALRVQEEGGMHLAESRYWAVFGLPPSQERSFSVPKPTIEQMPFDIRHAVELADRFNGEIQLGQLDIQIAQATVETQKSNALPKLTFNLDYKQKGGSSGDQQQGTAKVQLSWPLYSGGGQQSAIDGSLYTQHATALRLEDTRKRVHEAVRAAWYNWQTTKETAALLQNQSNIALEFLEQAREERKLGSRTLQEVLTGETAYLSAISNAVSAEIDHQIAAYQLLNAMGMLQHQPAVNVVENKVADYVHNEQGEVPEELATEIESVVDRVTEVSTDVGEVEIIPLLERRLPRGEQGRTSSDSAETESAAIPLVPKAAIQGDVDQMIFTSREAYQQQSTMESVDNIEPRKAAEEEKKAISIVGAGMKEMPRESFDNRIRIGTVRSGVRSSGSVRLVGPNGVGAENGVTRIQNDSHGVRLR